MCEDCTDETKPDKKLVDCPRCKTKDVELVKNPITLGTIRENFQDRSIPTQTTRLTTPGHPPTISVPAGSRAESDRVTVTIIVQGAFNRHPRVLRELRDTIASFWGATDQKLK